MLRKYPFYLLCTVVVAGCNIKKNKYEETALKIADVIISKYEFEKNYNAFIASLVSPVSLPKKQEWIENFINKTYFMAEAYQMGYLKDKRVTSDVERMAKYIITQPYGLYEEKTVFNNIKISEEEIKQAYEKNVKQLLVSFCHFPSMNEMNKRFPNNIPKSKEEFYNVLAKNKISFFEDSVICPSCQFSEIQYDLYALKENQVSKPLVTPQGVYLFLVKKTGKIPNGLNEVTKKKISDALMIQKKSSLRKKHWELKLNTLNMPQLENILPIKY